MIRLKHRSIIGCQRTIETGRRNGHPPRDDRHWHRNCRSLLYQLYQYCINILLCGIDVWRKMSVILMILTLSFWRYLPTILFCLVYNTFWLCILYMVYSILLVIAPSISSPPRNPLLAKSSALKDWNGKINLIPLFLSQNSLKYLLIILNMSRKKQEKSRW